MYFEVTLPNNNITHVIRFEVTDESDKMILWPMLKAYIKQAPWIEGKASKMALIFEPIMETKSDTEPKTA